MPSWWLEAALPAAVFVALFVIWVVLPSRPGEVDLGSRIRSLLGRRIGPVPLAYIVALLLPLLIIIPIGGAYAILDEGGTGEPATSDVRSAAPAVQAPLPPGQRTIFADVTASSGVLFEHHEFLREQVAMGGGAIAFDYNSDGFQDIYILDSEGPNALYRNNGDRTFTEAARAAGVNDVEGRGNGACAADYDNDGDQDLFVTNYGTSKLFRNTGVGTFEDVTADIGLQEPDDSYRATGCAWGDYDRDGFLDLIIARHVDERAPNMLDDLDFMPAVRPLGLFHGSRDGRFANVTELLGNTLGPATFIPTEPFGNIWGAGYQPGWLDYDNDGDLDLYVVNDFGIHIRGNVFWRNDGPSTDAGWTFTDISAASGADARIFGMGLAVGDYDLDGFFDMFVTNIGQQVLLRNNGDGRAFTDQTSAAGLDMARIGTSDRVGWGTLFFDYDNDGDEDLYVVSGFLEIPESQRDFDPPAELKEQPNVLMRNEGQGTFTDVSAISGADDRGMGRGGVFLDINNDGCLDLLVVNLGQEARLLQNTCDSGNNWLTIETVGTASNRDGIGARIAVSAGGATQIREIASGRGNMGQNMRAAHFGLGASGVADLVTVSWPSGVVQSLTDVPANQRLTVTEPR